MFWREYLGTIAMAGSLPALLLQEAQANDIAAGRGGAGCHVLPRPPRQIGPEARPVGSQVAPVQQRVPESEVRSMLSQHWRDATERAMARNREREQENRISKLKIKDMKRLIKHNQLKPLDPKDLTPMEETEKDGERTVNSAGLKAVEEGKEDMSNLGYHHEILDDPLKLKMKVRATDPPSRLEAEYSD